MVEVVEVIHEKRRPRECRDEASSIRSGGLGIGLEQSYQTPTGELDAVGPPAREEAIHGRGNRAGMQFV